MTGTSEQTPPPLRVALLRGINLGPNRRVPMARLREVAAGLGWTDVSTYLQSGNLLFRAPGTDHSVAAELSAALRAELGLSVDVIVRTGDQLRRLVDAHPFAEGDPTYVVIACFDRDVGELAARRLAELATASERVEVDGCDVFAHFPDGQAASKLAAGLIASSRPATGTARNLRTMTKLAELLLSDQG